MQIEILKPIAGLGDFVHGSRHQFSLDTGMTVEVEDGQAEKWVASGIARSVGLPAEEAVSVDQATEKGSGRVSGSAAAIPSRKPGKKGAR